MSGPWDKYKKSTPAADGPWAKYGATPAATKPTDDVSLADRAGNAALGAIQGSTLSLGDEIAGVGNSALDLLGGDTDVVKNYEKYRDVSRSMNKNAQEQSKGEYGAGQIVGGLAPALATGTILPTATIGQAAGAGAALGATQGFGESEKTGLGLAADTAIGGTIGGALGAGTAAAGKGLSALASKASDKLKGISRDAALDVFKGTPKQAQAIEQAGKDAVADNLLDRGIIKAGDTASSAGAKLKTAIKTSGEDVSAVYKQADKVATPEQMIKPDELIGGLEETLRRLEGNAIDTDLAPHVHKIAENISKTYGNTPLTFEQAHDLISKAGKSAYAGAALDPSAKKQLQQELVKDLKKVVYPRIAEVLQDKSALPAANKAFSQLKVVEAPAERAVRANTANSGISLKDYVASSGIGSTIGAAAGYNEGGGEGATLGGLTGAAAGLAGSKLLRTYGAGIAASGARSLAAGASALANQLDNGAPVADVIKRALAIGIPREVIEKLRGPHE